MALPDAWPIVLGALAAIVTAGVAWHWLRSPDRNSLMRERMEVDAKEPLRNWAQSAFLVVTHDCDYGYLERGEARTLLREWWEVHGTHELLRTLQELERSGRPDNAWDLVRFMLVARLGAGALYFDHDDSWEMIAPVARRLQAAYSDWRPMAQAYVMARRQWKELPADGSEDDDSTLRMLNTIAELQDGRWATLPFGAELQP